MINLLEDPSVATVIPTIHLGSPFQVGPLTIFPVWTDAPVPKKPVPVLPPEGVAINELASGPSVALLEVHNSSDTPFVLLEGTVVDGGWQHRVTVHDMLIAAGQNLHVDVRCVEAGRWSGASAQEVSTRRAPLAISGALRGLRRDRSASHDAPSRRADQGEVWERVASYSQTLHAASATSSMVDVFDQVEVSAQVRALVPKPVFGQRGVLIGVGGHPAMLEFFDHPRSFARQWDLLVETLLVSTAHLGSTPTSGRRARAFVQRLSGRSVPVVAEAGAGFLAEDVDDLVSVRSLASDAGHGLHTSALNVRHRLVLAA